MVHFLFSLKKCIESAAFCVTYCTCLYRSYAAYSQNAQLWCPVEQMNYTACPGNDVIFLCTTETPEVLWEIFNQDGFLVDAFYSDLTKYTNDTQMDEYFTFEKTGYSNSTLSFEAQYALDGYKVSCTDVKFTTNYITNVTTSLNDTANCYINIPGISYSLKLFQSLHCKTIFYAHLLCLLHTCMQGQSFHNIANSLTCVYIANLQ